MAAFALIACETAQWRQTLVSVLPKGSRKVCEAFFEVEEPNIVLQDKSGSSLSKWRKN